MLRSSLGSVDKMSVISEQYLLGIQERTVAASGYIAANPVFMIPDLPHEYSVMVLEWVEEEKCVSPNLVPYLQIPDHEWIYQPG